MLTAQGCRTRITRLLDRLDERVETVLICRPEHVFYFCGYMASPNSLKLRAAYSLMIERSGETTLLFDGWGKLSETIHADNVQGGGWMVESPEFSGPQSAAKAAEEALRSRGLSVIGAETAALPAAIAASLETVDIEPIINRMRLVKDSDELDIIRAAMRVGEAFHASARENMRPGMTELEIYTRGVHDATAAAGGPFVMMCDFRSGPELAAGGHPTDRVIEPGDNLLMDIFPYVNGYRCDITNTLNAGRQPSPDQEKAMATALTALAASEALCKPGVTAHELHKAQDDAIRAADPTWSLRGHAGHCLGLEHPEPPDFIPDNHEPILEGMVITFEPGVYDPSFHGVRVEHNYLVTADGLERLSHHQLGLI